MSMPPPEAAARLLEKLRKFIATELDEQERALFAALVAPGIARAHAEPEVEGFGLSGWATADLPNELSSSLRRDGVRVEGLGLSDP
jgi:hypothetical protein